MAVFCFLRKQLFKKYIENIVFNTYKYENQVRLASTQTPCYKHCVEELKDRGLLQVSGSEVSQFMQGIITNDMKHLDEGSRSMYTMFLNTKGRVMYDAILYKNPNSSTVFVECDKTAVNDLQKHLKIFKVRRKVEINVLEGFKIWVIYSPVYAEEINKENDVRVKDISQEKIVPCQAINFDSSIQIDNKMFDSLLDDDIIISWDPRLPLLGARVLAKESVDVEQLAKEKSIPIEKSNISFKTFRYKLGVGEGIRELPYGQCFPLEMNCDYLHGVSFHKGCYIGQELTARTHHTGVVRRRLMPIFLNNFGENIDNIQLDTPIEVNDEKGRAIGKLRGIEKDTAIGLVRISEALSASQLKIGKLTGFTTKPKWWPREAPREHLLTRKE